MLLYACTRPRPSKPEQNVARVPLMRAVTTIQMARQDFSRNSTKGREAVVEPTINEIITARAITTHDDQNYPGAPARNRCNASISPVDHFYPANETDSR